MRSRALVAFLGIVLSINAFPSFASANKVIGENQNRKTISITIGATITVKLNNTYWNLNKLSGNSLKQISPPITVPTMPGAKAPANCQVPGMGCGKVTWKLKAVATGSTTVSASRTSCGEAFRCTPEQSTYSVKIVVR